MKESCMECVSKHVGKALVSLNEHLNGYPDHIIDAFGELGHAEDESFAENPALTLKIREFRKLIESGITERYLCEEDEKTREAVRQEIIDRCAETRQRMYMEWLSAVKGGKDISPGKNV